MAHSKQTIKCYVNVRSISISNQPTSWVSLISSITLPFLFCFYISFRDCMVSESVCLAGWVIWIGVYSVYASSKTLYVNRTCSSSSSNQTSTRISETPSCGTPCPGSERVVSQASRPTLLLLVTCAKETTSHLQSSHRPASFLAHRILFLPYPHSFAIRNNGRLLLW